MSAFIQKLIFAFLYLRKFCRNRQAGPEITVLHLTDPVWPSSGVLFPLYPNFHFIQSQHCKFAAKTAESIKQTRQDHCRALKSLPSSCVLTNGEWERQAEDKSVWKPQKGPPAIPAQEPTPYIFRGNTDIYYKMMWIETRLRIQHEIFAKENPK